MPPDPMALLAAVEAPEEPGAAPEEEGGGDPVAELADTLGVDPGLLVDAIMAIVGS